MTTKAANRPDTQQIVAPKLSTMDAEDLITPEELAAYLRIETGTLNDTRVDGGEWPKFIKFPGVRGHVRYMVGEIRRWLGDRTFENTGQASLGAAHHFGEWVNSAALTDEWPFRIINGRPVDFVQAIGQQIEGEPVWLSLEAYLLQRSSSAIDQALRGDKQPGSDQDGPPDEPVKPTKRI